MRNSEIVVNVGVVLLQLRRLTILADSIAVLVQPGVGLPKVVMSLCVVVVLLEIFFVSLDSLFVFRLLLVLFSECFVTQSEPKMSLSQFRVQLHGLLKSLDRLFVVIVAVQFPAFGQQLAGGIGQTLNTYRLP